jgi:hypothetical protein
MMANLTENQFVGCGEFVGMVIWEIETHLFGNSRKQYLPFVKGSNCEIHVDVGLYLIFVKGLCDICGRAFVRLLGYCVNIDSVRP